MLETLANRLHSAGRTTILLALPDDATGDLNVQAGILAARVTQALNAGAQSVDLVGYSAGGIVIGLFVAAHPKEVRQIVTIGSPLHGTALASLAVSLNLSSSRVSDRLSRDGAGLVSARIARRSRACAYRRRRGRRCGPPTIWSCCHPIRHASPVRRTSCFSRCVPTTAWTISSLPADPLVAGITLRALDTSDVGSPSASDCSSLRALGSGT